MDKSRKIITILLFFKSTVKAQDTTSQHDMNPLHPSLAVVLLVLSIMFCITFVIVAYAKFCHRHVPYDPNLVQDPDGIVRTRSRFSGIDRSIIESLPFFQFSSLKGSKEGLECAVCLSRFEETEILRLLPKCRHAFHMSCIDKWLENHSSCPLCRYKFDVGDLKYLTYTNSFRNQHIPSDDQNLEFYIQREQNHEKSSRFNNPFQKLSKGKRPEEPLIQKFKNEHKFQHKITVSDVIYKSRWSEVNSSDILSLKSEMLNVISSKRFSSPKGSNSGRFTNAISAKEHILKIKDDMEWKRLYESKISKAENTSSDPSSTSEQCTILPRLVDSDKKRSMSEITNISRFTELSSMNGLSTPASMAKNEKIRRVWLPIARKTIQRFAGHERSLLDTSKHGINDV